MFKPLYSNAKQQLFEKTLQSNYYENNKAITCHCQIDTFAMRKDEWGTKEITGKSMKTALHVQHYGKRHLLG